MSSIPWQSAMESGERRRLRTSETHLPRGLTAGGMFVFAVCLLQAASGMQEVRQAMTSLIPSRSLGLSFHPYLIPVVLALPFLLIARVTAVPRGIAAAMLAFFGVYIGSTFYGGVDYVEQIRIGGAVATLAVTALAVRTREDFNAGVLGLCLAVAVLSIIGIQAADRVGEGMISGTGRNTFSLFALPAMLLGGYLVTQRSNTSSLVVLTIMAAILFSVVATLMTLNRSGWLGIGVVFLLLFPGSRARTLLILAAVVVGAMLFFRDPIEVQTMQDRLVATRTGTDSDWLRVELLKQSGEICLEAPLLGVSPEQVGTELGRRLGYRDARLAAHNVFAHVGAGSGIPCLALMLVVGALFWRWEPDAHLSGPLRRRFLAARNLLRMILILWCVRGFFTHEILYSPTFNAALGLAVGLCLRYSAAPAERPLPAFAADRGEVQPPRRRRRLRASSAART